MIVVGLVLFGLVYTLMKYGNQLVDQGFVGLLVLTIFVSLAGGPLVGAILGDNKTESKYKEKIEQLKPEEFDYTKLGALKND